MKYTHSSLMNFDKRLLAIFLILILPIQIIAETKIKIGMLIPLSGAFAELGEDLTAGANLAKMLYPDVNVEFVYADSKADPATAIAEYRKLTEIDKVSAIYLLRSGVGLAVNPLSAKEKLPVVGGVAYDDYINQNPYAFRAWSTSREEGELMAEEILKDLSKKTALLYTSDDYMISVAKGFKLRASLKGHEVSPEFEFLPDNTNFKSEILKIQNSGADSVFANLTLAHLGIFIKQLHASGSKLKVYSSFMVAKKDVQDVAGKDTVKGIKYVEIDSNYPKAKSTYQRESNKDNFNSLMISSYAGIALILEALKNNPAITDKNSLYSEMLKINSLNLPDRSIPVLNREIKFPVSIGIVR